MQHLFWIGSPFFQSSLAECGWKVHFFNFEEVAVFGWKDLVSMAGWEPEVVVVADKSRPPFVLGMETFPCLTVFYAVDSHIHSWYPLYAQGFDLCLVSLRDHIDIFRHKRLPDSHVIWTPPFARNHDAPDPDVQVEHDCLFVGTVDEVNTPLRASFMRELKAHVPGLCVTHGDYRKLFGTGRVLINHCEGGDLNFRVFEALGCGGCLVTPRVGHGMNELFVDGEQLVMYEPGNVHDAANKINFLLGDAELCSYIAETGLQLVDDKHRARHRAQSFTDQMCDLWMNNVEGIVQDRIQRATQIREHWLRVPYLLLANEMGHSQLQKYYADASKGIFV